MKDKSISFLNSSLLMHWVADYEKSITLIKQAESALNKVGLEFNLDEEHYYMPSAVELTDSLYDTFEQKKKEKDATHINDNTLQAREISSESSLNSGDLIEERRNQKEQLIVAQTRILYNNSKKAKRSFEKLNMKQQENGPFVTEHSERISCLLIRTDVLNYKIRFVINDRFDWNEECIRSIDLKDYKTQCISFNSHESVFHIEDDRVSGEVHFSSLGLGEGKFYEQQGVKSPDRCELIILIIKELAQKVFNLSKF
ncbi:hypothetical protein [Paenibacillus taichungensis]